MTSAPPTSFNQPFSSYASSSSSLASILPITYPSPSIVPWESTIFLSQRFILPFPFFKAASKTKKIFC
jgi:hypothetical protein